MNIKYFDHAATTAVSEEVLKEMLPYFALNYGNASSIYSIGRKSKRAIEEARNRVARAINAKSSREIFFTSCGSESDNLAIKGIAYANKHKGNHIITSKIEHHAVINTCKTLEKQGFEVTYLNVDRDGFININELISNITEKTILISIMFANNEIGTIEPIKEIGNVARNRNIIFHTDSVQAVGNTIINVKDLNVDALSMSAHKFYGPKGVGALYVREGVEFEKIQDGGHQEKDKRAGTENVAGIVGLGKAIEIASKNLEKNINYLTGIRDYYIERIRNKIPKAILNGSDNKRLPGNANFSFKGIDGQELLLKLDEMGICASSGSACSSGLSTPSHVLMAIGLEEQYAQGSLRTTFGIENTKDDIDVLVNSICNIINKMNPNILTN